MNIAYKNTTMFQKQYGNHLVLSGQEVCLYKGKVYLLLGDNGAGKSTLMRLILGLIYPSEGQIAPLDKAVGYIPDQLQLPDHLTINRYLTLLCEARDPSGDYQDRIGMFTREWNLDVSKKIGCLSKGMRQKLLIIQALIHYPSIYLFDEPLNGLDQEAIHHFITLVHQLKRHKKMIGIITHDLHPFASCWDVKIVIQNGLICEQTR